MSTTNMGEDKSKRVLHDVSERVKTVIVGDYCVGKTSLAQRFARNEFREKYKSTVAASFFAQSIEIDGKKIIFQIWDTAGQERYRSLIPMYLRGSRVAFVVYDISNQESFKNLKFWTNYLKENGPTEMQLAILGNKSDLQYNREVPLTEAKEFAIDIGAYFLEVSAKSGENVQKLFIDTGKSLLTGLSMEKMLLSRSIKLDSRAKKHRSNCCSGIGHRESDSSKSNNHENYETLNTNQFQSKPTRDNVLYQLDHVFPLSQ